MNLIPILRHGFLARSFGMGLLICAGLGLVLPWREAAMLGWCANVAVHAGLLFYSLSDAEPEAMRERARTLTDGRAIVIMVSLAAATASLLVVAMLLGMGQQAVREQVISVLTIVAAWFYVHLLFAQEYAHEFWMRDGGLDFPGSGDEPPFGDFVYFAFVVGCTFQVSDATTNTPRMRRFVLLHGLTAFWFNTVILASAVSIISNLGGG